jgi:protein-disulfide isomerase
MQNRKAKTVEIIPSKDMWTGPAQAPVKLVMYGDYESEACAKANEIVRKLLGQYKNELKFNFRHFPLTRVHQHAHKAAEAAIGAGQQGKFWEMHNLLFTRRRHLGSISLKEYAKEVGVVNKNFLNELVDSVYGWQVRTDLLDGLHKGVRDVPAIYINDNLYKGPLTLNALSHAVQDALPQPKRKRA